MVIERAPQETPPDTSGEVENSGEVISYTEASVEPTPSQISTRAWASTARR